MEKHKQIFEELNKKINEQILKFIPQNKLQLLYEPFNYIISSGGKRIRPVLTMLSCGACGANTDEALEAALAIEILHNFTLVHDDIMDKSPLRRGNETIHNKWNEETAILTGDIMVGYSYRLLQSYINHQRASKIFYIFTNALIEVCEGQALDMEFNNRQDVTKEDYLLMIRKKTAEILIACTTIGAHIANAEENEIIALKEYALNLGLGFQLQDDILDLYANKAELGKRIGQDIIEGKKTYLIILAKELANNKNDRQLIDLFMQNNGLSEEFIPQMQELIKRVGAFDKSKEVADYYFNKASKSIDVLKQNQYTDNLFWLLESLKKRNY